MRRNDRAAERPDSITDGIRPLNIVSEPMVLRDGRYSDDAPTRNVANPIAVAAIPPNNMSA